MLTTALPPGFVPKSTALVNTLSRAQSSNELLRRHLVRSTFTTIQGIDVSEVDHASLRSASVMSQLVLEDAVWFVEPLAFKKEQSISISCERVEVRADQDVVKRILINLLKNAMEYSPRGGKIEVAVSVMHGCAVFSVLDEGPGIAADKLNSLFERSNTGRNQTCGRAVGGGLGLPICKELVEKFGGAIGVGSGDAGSYFWFSVPLA